jgi:hypothetical protein
MTTLDDAVALVLYATSTYDYEFFGIRRETYEPEDGAPLPNSINHDTQDELDGTSVMHIRRGDESSIRQALRSLEPYMGRWMVLAGSDYSSGYGEDPGERLLVHAVVLEVFTSPVEFKPGRQKR